MGRNRNKSLRFFQHAARVLLPRPKTPLSQFKVKRILVYGDIGIGNMLLFTPAIRALRERFPASEIAILSGNSGAIEVASRFGFIDKVIKIPAAPALKLLLILRFALVDR